MLNVSVFLLVRARGWAARWRTQRGLANLLSNAGFIVAVLIMLAVVFVFVLGPGKTWATNLLNSITSIAPPTMPSGA